MTPHAVGVAMLALLAGIIIWDSYLALDRQPANTISANLRRWGRWWPPLRIIVSVAIGVVLGHLWWT